MLAVLILGAITGDLIYGHVKAKPIKVSLTYFSSLCYLTALLLVAERWC